MAGLESIYGLRDRVAKTLGQIDLGEPQMEAISEHEKEILDMNREQLYEFGYNPLGISIGSYSPKTIAIKKEKGQPYDRVTLKDTGDFYAAFQLRVDKAGFSISSTDWKTEELLGKYGNVFGLTAENRLYVAWHFLFPFMVNFVKKNIYGN